MCGCDSSCADIMTESASREKLFIFIYEIKVKSGGIFLTLQFKMIKIIVA